MSPDEIPALNEVHAVLSKLPPGVVDWWLAEPLSALEGLSPLQALQGGHVHRVINAARAFVAR